MTSQETSDSVDADTLKIYPERRGGEPPNKFSDYLWGYRGPQAERIHCEKQIYKCIQKCKLFIDFKDLFNY